MREMKDSGVEWIGKIPRDWKVCKIKNIAQIYTGNSIRDEEKGRYENSDNARPYIATKDIDVTLGTANYENGLYIKKNDLSFKVACKGSTLMCIEGGNAGKKKTYLLHNVSFGNKLCCFYSEIINKTYLYFFLSSPNFEMEFANCISGLIGGVSVSVLKNMAFLIPSKENQQCIANILKDKCSKIDAIIAPEQAVIEKLKEYKLSVITEAVTKGLNPNVPMKDSGVRFVNYIPALWENRKMMSILSMRVVDGPHESPELLEEGIPYISATAIENGRINFSLCRGYISEEYCDICDKRYIPQMNDILVIKLGASTGQVAMVKTAKRFNIWVPLAAVRCNSEAMPKFVYYCFQSDYFIKQMELSWTFGTQQTLGVKTIERLRIILPPYTEQQSIADYLDHKCSRIDGVIERKQALITKLTEYKKSLIYEAVTGKKEV